MKRSILLKLLVSVTLLFTTLFALPTADARFDEAVSVSARSAVVMERSTGTVLYGKNAHEQLPMASTTKIMTALVALEHSTPDEKVTVSHEAVGIEGSSMYLMPGEVLLMSDLLYGLMLASGNDAAIAIAMHVAGTTEAFVELMNQKAVELGLLNTHFVTPNGLHDDDHYTTAYDLCVIARAAMENETFSQIVGTTYYTTQSGNTIRYFKNKNKLLWQFEGATGLKTGYTSMAGKCLAFSAKRNDMELIGVVLKSGDIFGESTALLDYAFDNYHMVPLISKDEPISFVRLEKCDKKLLALGVLTDIMIPVEVSEEARIKTRVLAPKVIGQTVNKGDPMGTLELYDGSRLIYSIPLVAMDDARLLTFWDYLSFVVKGIT